MAGVRIAANTGDVSFSTSTITVAQVKAASNHRIRIERVRVSFKGTSSAEAPVLVELCRQTTAGTMTTVTPVKITDSDPGTIQTTAQKTATGEPTTGNIKASHLVHPQSSYDFVFPPGRELYVDGGDYLGVRLNTPTQAGTVDTSIELEE